MFSLCLTPTGYTTVTMHSKSKLRKVLVCVALFALLFLAVYIAVACMVSFVEYITSAVACTYTVIFAGIGITSS